MQKESILEIFPNVHLVPNIIVNPYLLIDPEGLTLIDAGMPGAFSSNRKMAGIRKPEAPIRITATPARANQKDTPYGPRSGRPG